MTEVFILILTMLSGDVGPWPTPVSAAFCSEVIREVDLLGMVPVERTLPGRPPFIDFVVHAECRPVEMAQS